MLPLGQVEEVDYVAVLAGPLADGPAGEALLQQGEEGLVYWSLLRPPLVGQHHRGGGGGQGGHGAHLREEGEGWRGRRRRWGRWGRWGGDTGRL